MATGYLTLFDVSGNGLGMASAATSITTENRSLTVGSGTLTAATGTFTNVGGTLSTVSQPNVTTLGGVTSIASLITISGSQVGIGTSPSYLLHVSGTSTGSIASAVQNLSTGTSAQARFQLINDRNSAAASQGLLSIYSSTNTISLAGLTLADMVLLDASGTNNQGLLIATESAKPIYFATNSSLRGRFDSSGNFGINVAPSARLHVNETSGGAVAIIGSSDGGANDDKLQFRSAYSFLANSSDITGQILGAPSNTGGRLVFSTSQSTTGTLTSRMLIDDAGNVAIGNLSPSYLLHAQGTALGTSSADSSVIARFQTAAVGNGVYLDIQKYRNGAGSDHSTEETRIRRTVDVSPMGFLAFGSNYCKLNGNGGSGIYINSSEQVAIGNTSPSRYLDIGNVILNGANAYEIALGRSDAPATIRVGQAATTQMFFNWSYNATASSAYGSIGTYGGGNNICLQEGGGNIGITTTSLTGYKLRIAGDVRLNGLGNFGVYIETALGTTAGTAVACASFASDAIYSSNVGTITNAYNVFIGTGITGGTITNGYSLYVQDPAYGSTKVCAYFANQVGIAGNPVSTHKLSVTGTAYLSTGTAWTTSDARIKTDVRDIDSAIDVIERLRPRKFKYREEWVNDATGVNATDDYYGFIADEVEMVMPECVELKTGLHCFNGRKILHRQREEAKMRAKKEEVAIEEKEEPVDPEPEPEKGFENLKNFSMHNILVVAIAAIKELSAQVKELRRS